MKKIKKIVFLLLLTAMAGVCLPVVGQVTAPGNNLYTLFPPDNFTGHEIDCNCYLHWETPQTPTAREFITGWWITSRFTVNVEDL